MNANMLQALAKGGNGNYYVLDNTKQVAEFLSKDIAKIETKTIGVCGGMAMCASCQCYVLNDLELPEKSDDEEAMLSEAFNVKHNSRLGCQIHTLKIIKQ